MLEKIILQSSIFVVFLPLVVAAIKFRSFSKELKIISLHLLLVNLLSAAAAVLYFSKRNNLPLLHLYTVVELIMIAWFYSMLLTRRSKKKNINHRYSFYCFCRCRWTVY